MDKKLLKELKFKIGEQYGKYEFDLDWIKSVLDNNLRYEVYQYIGNDKITIFGFEVQKILLAYNCDFLAGFFYYIKSDCDIKILSNVKVEFFWTNSIKINVINLNEEISIIYVITKKNKNNTLIDIVIKLGRI